MEQDLTNSAIGPQHPNENQFKARMRFHLSWYRAKVLKVPFGQGPRPNSRSYYGNMLTQENGDQGLNFLYTIRATKPVTNRLIYTGPC